MITKAQYESLKPFKKDVEVWLADQAISNTGRYNELFNLHAKISGKAEKRGCRNCAMKKVLPAVKKWIEEYEARPKQTRKPTANAQNSKKRQNTVRKA